MVNESFPERLPVSAVVHGGDPCAAHRRGAAEHAVQPGRRHHVDDRRHAAAGLADQPRERPVVLHLGGRVGPVTQLVLQPLDAHGVAGTVRQHPGEQEAGQAARPLGQHEEQVAHRRRVEPLVPGEQVRAVARRRRGLRAGGPGAHVRAALLLGHGHAGQQPGLGLRRAQARIVGAGGEQRLEPAGQLRRVPQRGHRRVRHRHRAAVPGLGLAPHVELRRAGHVRARLAGRPRGRVQAVRDRHRHQGVPGRMVVDLVDPVAVPVVRPEPGDVLVGEPGLLLGLLGASQGAELVQLGKHGAGLLAVQRLEQPRVLRHVVPGERRDLVEHLMRNVRSGAGIDRHLMLLSCLAAGASGAACRGRAPRSSTGHLA